MPEKEDFYSHLNMAVTYPEIWGNIVFSKGFWGKNEDTLKSVYILFEGGEMVLNGFKSKVFSLQPTDNRCNTDMWASHLKILTP